VSWLTPHWTKDGPGVPRDAAPKQGLALLADVLSRHWWELIQLNLLIALFSLPLVTIPAAMAAGTRVSVLMLEDRPLYLGRDFVGAIRRLFWRATALGAIAAVVTAIGAYGVFIFAQAARANLLFALPLTVSASVAAFALIAAAWGFCLLAMREQPLADVLRLALLGALARPLPVLAAFAFTAALWLLHVLFYPASIFMPAILNFSLGTLAVTFGVHRAAARLLALGATAQAGRTTAWECAQRASTKGRKDRQ
jgi:uncharacterized membrane protein YesL